MKPTVLHDQYIVVDPDGDFEFRTVTSLLDDAIFCQYNNSMPSSTTAAAKKAGFKLIKCDIVLTNIKEVIL